jgi:hypothetical protein
MLFQTIPAYYYGMVWLEVNSTYGKPSCNYLQTLINMLKIKGKNVGIRSDYDSWSNIFGNNAACP